MNSWQNLGMIDRLLRLAVGLVLLVVAVLASLGAVWTPIVLIVAALMVVTSMAGFCPAYLPFRFRTTGGKPSPA